MRHREPLSTQFNPASGNRLVNCFHIGCGPAASPAPRQELPVRAGRKKALPGQLNRQLDVPMEVGSFLSLPINIAIALGKLHRRGPVLRT
jgi:hypothetical protein